MTSLRQQEIYRNLPQEMSAIDSQSYANGSRDINQNNTSLLCKTKIRTPASVHKVHYWAVDRVLHWLKKNCKESYRLYSKLFREHDITGRVLVYLTDAKLLLMGVLSAEHREEILLEILRLRLQYERRELKNLQLSTNNVTDDEV